MVAHLHWLASDHIGSGNTGLGLFHHGSIFGVTSVIGSRLPTSRSALCRSVVVLGEPLLDFEAIESNCSGGRTVIRQLTSADAPPHPRPRHVPPSSYISHRQHLGLSVLKQQELQLNRRLASPPLLGKGVPVRPP